MPRCQRVNNGVRCKGWLAPDGAGGFEDCTLCSRPMLMGPGERSEFYSKNAAAILDDVKSLGRVAARIKWKLSKDALFRQEKLWVKQGIIKEKDRQHWTEASLLLRNQGASVAPVKATPSLSSCDRGRRVTAIEQQYADKELNLPLGDVSMGNDMKLSMNLKVSKKALQSMVRKAIDEQY